MTTASRCSTAYRRHDGKVFLYAFDLIELDGDDLRGVSRLMCARPHYGPCWLRWGRESNTKRTQLGNPAP